MFSKVDRIAKQRERSPLFIHGVKLHLNIFYLYRRVWPKVTTRIVTLILWVSPRRHCLKPLAYINQSTSINVSVWSNKSFFPKVHVSLMIAGDGNPLWLRGQDIPLYGIWIFGRFDKIFGLCVNSVDVQNIFNILFYCIVYNGRNEQWQFLSQEWDNFMNCLVDPCRCNQVRHSATIPLLDRFGL